MKHKSIFGKLAAVSVFMVLPLIVEAQEVVKLEQLISEPATGFPADFDAETAGIRIGMTEDQVTEILKEKYANISDQQTTMSAAPKIGEVLREGFDFDLDEYTLSFGDNTGFDITFYQFTALQSVTKSTDILAYGLNTKRESGDESLSVVYGTPLTGNRVQMIRRAVKFEEPVALDVMEKALTDKYGNPQAIKSSEHEKIFYYGFKAGGALEETENTGQSSRIVMCSSPITNQRSVEWTGRYAPISFRSVNAYLSNRNGGGEGFKSCDGGMSVTMLLTGNKNVVAGLTVFLTDNAAAAEDIAELNKIVDQAQKDFQSKPAGSRKAPDL